MPRGSTTICNNGAPNFTKQKSFSYRHILCVLFGCMHDVRKNINIIEKNIDFQPGILVDILTDKLDTGYINRQIRHRHQSSDFYPKCV